MIENLENYLKVKMNVFKKCKEESVEEDEIEFYRGQIIALKNVYKYIQK